MSYPSYSGLQSTPKFDLSSLAGALPKSISRYTPSTQKATASSTTKPPERARGRGQPRISDRSGGGRPRQNVANKQCLRSQAEDELSDGSDDNGNFGSRVDKRRSRAYKSRDPRWHEFTRRDEDEDELPHDAPSYDQWKRMRSSNVLHPGEAAPPPRPHDPPNLQALLEFRNSGPKSLAEATSGQPVHYTISKDRTAGESKLAMLSRELGPRVLGLPNDAAAAAAATTAAARPESPPAVNQEDKHADGYESDSYYSDYSDIPAFSSTLEIEVRKNPSTYWGFSTIKSMIEGFNIPCHVSRKNDAVGFDTAVLVRYDHGSTAFHAKRNMEREWTSRGFPHNIEYYSERVTYV